MSKNQGPNDGEQNDGLELEIETTGEVNASEDFSEEETSGQPVKPSPIFQPQFDESDYEDFEPPHDLDYLIADDPTEDLLTDEKTEQFRQDMVFVPPPLATKEPHPPNNSEDNKDTPWQGLHIASLIINLLPQAWRTLRVGWPLLLALYFSTGNAVEATINFMIILVFFAMTLLRTLTHFLTLRFRIHDNQLEVKEGLIFRKFRSLSPSRIQNTEVVQNPLHKIAGLVELRIETAGSTSDGSISAISRTTAESLMADLQRISKKSEPTEESKQESEVPDFQSTVIEAVLFGLSKRTAGTIAVLSLIGMELLSILDPQEAQEVTSALDWKTTIGLFLLAFGGSWLWSAGRAVLSYGVFRLHLSKSAVKTEEGLLTRRRIEIPRSKIQMLTFSQPLLRRSMGYGTLYVETAALGMADGEVRASEVILPMVDHQDYPGLTQKITPYLDVDLETVELQPAHPRAFYRMALAGLAQATLLAGGLMWYFQAHLLVWLALLLIPFSILSAYLDWSRQGWLVSPNTIISRWGFFSRNTVFLARDKIQSIHIYQSPLMRWHGLGRVVISVASSSVELPDIGIEKAHEVMDSLRASFLVKAS